jgi:threonine dehydrogenase-like Zn-dependent dehydrogenase
MRATIPTTVRALVLQSGALTLHSIDRPNRPGECLIRVTHAGICGTDLQMVNGYADFTGVLGHEFVGIVQDAPAKDARWLGKRVVGEINVGCHTCYWCVRQVKEHCVNRTVLGIRGRDGAFAEYLSLPAANLHEVPDTVSDVAAVFVEPVAAACRIVEQLDIMSITRIAVLGDGRLGNLTAQVLRLRTKRLVLLGHHRRKLDIARAVGVTARDETTVREQFDVVVEATGRPEGLARAMELVMPRGTIVLKSTFHDANGAPLWPIPVHEITVVGSRCGPFAPAIDLITSGAVQTAPLVSAVVDLDDYRAAFLSAAHEMKVVFRLQGGASINGKGSPS